MKAGQVVLLVLTGAIGGAVLISMAQRLRPAIPAHVSAQVREPVPAPAAGAGPPKPSPMPERREAPQPQRFNQKAERAPASASSSGPTVAPPPARTEPENPTPAGSPGSTPAPPPRQVTLNAGLLIPVRLVDGLSTERNAPGDAFLATLDGDLAVDGLVIAERGARVEGTVVAADTGGAAKAAALTVELTRLYTNDGQTLAIQTDGFERHAESAGRNSVLLPAVTRITFRVKTAVQLTDRLRRN